ncbi:hypothetical protein KBC55_01410 [Patescibacteria group bacterium]|nr:hypothetical protein [Patescibacteria group bacterium]
MIALIVKVLFWSVFATILACLEIESEGKYGWAHKAPTWYRTTGFFGKLYGMIMGGKPLTGYHLFMFLFTFMIFHVPFFSGVVWSAEGELLACAMYFAWCTLWDYIWFVLNPAYAGRFTRNNVWWHSGSPWIFGLFPLDYLSGVTLSLGLAGAAAWHSGEAQLFVDHLAVLIGFGAYVALMHLCAPAYRYWYGYMRLSDDRDKVDIVYP